ncbi:unnamed protein product [Musa acuminata subsp. burmannicoides]
MSTALVIGGWFAQSFIQTLLDKASNCAIQQLARRRGLHDDLRRLRTSLLRIHAILDKAETRWNHKNTSLVELVRQLKDAAYDAEDLLEELEYQAAKQKVEHRGDQISDLFSFSLSTASEWLGADGDDAGTRLREIQGKLCNIAADMMDIMQLLAPDDGGRQFDWKVVRRETSSFLTENVVFGRDQEREKVVELLLDSGSGNSSFSVLPLVGIGGVGKTTLAQLVYNDNRVGNYFHLKVWVCVSDNFNVKRLTKEIIESATKVEQSDKLNLDTLQQILKEKIASERFLLVLDDVWSENRDDWERLCAPLRFAARGSKVIVTTRDTKIASIFGTMKEISLDGLEDDAYWELFKNCAFGSVNPQEHLELEVIGRKIAGKLKGSPLAAKTLGSLLRSDVSQEHWRTIMESEVWQLPQAENEILPVLWLSYQHFPGHLRQCFAFCAVFHKDYLFYKHELIQTWMAEGFIAPQGNKRVEDVGSSYFHELVNRSFFQESQWRGRYVMHDLIHDLAQFISVGECHRIDDDKSKETPSTTRHLSVALTEQTKLVDFSGYNKLRTLMINNQRNQYPYMTKVNSFLLPQSLFRRLKRIHVLVLQKCGMKELPDIIGDLIQLRYLDISYNARIQRLPESLCDLYNLQALRLWGCQLQSFPQGMSKLINLRQLHVEDEIISKIYEVGKLISLQELSAFKVLKNHGNKLAELSGLTQLRGTLRITNLENVGSKEEASKAKLHSKQYLEALELEWAAGQVSSLEHELLVSEEVLLGLQPHHFLKSLTIRGYSGATVPSWLDVKMQPNLGTLKLENCTRLEGLSYIGQLPHLKVLHMKRMPVVKQMSHELCGCTKSKLFPRLEELVLEDMPTLEEFPNLAQLPCLKIIHMKNMFAVKHIGRELYGDIESNCFLSLEELVLQDMLTLEELPNLGQLPHLKVIHMKNMSALKLIGRELCGFREKIWFPRLEVLVLKNMLALEELPSLGQLPCLKVLRIQVSKVGHGLFSATRNKWFPRLEELEIKGMLTFEELHSLEKLPCLKVFRIKGLPAVKKIGHGLFDSTCQREGFPRLEELVLRDMPAWEEWSWAEREELFSCLCRLKIEQCPKLKCLPPVPQPLIKLELWQVGLTGLPELCKGIGGGSSTRTASLSLLHIIKCPNLRNLGEGLLSNHLPHINAIRIWECAELLWLPVKRFREFTTLENLSIRNCPKLMSMTQCEENDLLLPPSIKALELGDCGNLGKSLPGCLHNLSSLTQLAISNCPYMVSFPREVMLHLKELGTVRIENCDGLRSIEGLQVLKSLKRLAIIGCPRLLLNEGDEQGEVLSLLELSVDKTALLKLSLIKNTLPFIHSLRIIWSPQKVMFDLEEQELVHSLTALRRLEFFRCKNLQSLPTELHTLPSLHALVVSDCPQIQSLPEKGLPTLLTDLGFDHCHPVLTAQLEKHLADMKSSGRFHPVYA